MLLLTDAEETSSEDDSDKVDRVVKSINVGSSTFGQSSSISQGIF